MIRDVSQSIIFTYVSAVNLNEGILNGRISICSNDELLMCTYGPRNMFYAIPLLRELPEDDQEVNCDVLQRNAYFCHPENILLWMLADIVVQIRQKAVKII